jgi:hypothetical protein
MRTAFYVIHSTRIRTIVERSTGRLRSAWSLAQQSMGRSMPRNNFGRRIQKQLTSTVGLILLAGAPSGNGHLENKATRRFSTLQDGQRRRWPALTRLFPTKRSDIGKRRASPAPVRAYTSSCSRSLARGTHTCPASDAFRLAGSAGPCGRKCFLQSTESFTCNV